MNKFRFFTSGESHGQCLNAIVDGMPSGITIDKAFINNELAKRQIGYGRGGRMLIEKDTAEIKSGVRFNKTTGSPICLEIKNRDWQNWTIPMSVEEVNLKDPEIFAAVEAKKITKLRPGHADFAGAIKYNHRDIRNILERSSARETAARVAVGAIAKSLLNEFGITGYSYVSQIGKVKIEDKEYENIENLIEKNDLRCPDPIAYEKMKQEIDKAKDNGDTLGGSVVIEFTNMPVGLGSFVQWDRKIDGRLSQALMSIPAVKSVEFGKGSQVASMKGSETHDEIFFENGKYYRKTNNSGGIEGGMTNGENIVIKVSMKAIPTMKKPLQSVDIETKTPYQAHFERSDTCAVSACGIVAEAMVAIVIADAFLEKFGGDSLEEIKTNYKNYANKIED